MIKEKGHYVAGIVAFVIWGFFPMALRQLTVYSAGEILFFRIFFSFVLILVILPIFRRKSSRLSWQAFISFSSPKRFMVVSLTLTGGILLALNWLFFIYTVNSINLKTASFSYLICPVITSVLGFLLLSEKLTLIKWIAVGLCAISCILIGSASLHELYYSLLTAITYALYLISQRKNQGFDRMLLLAIQMTFAFIILVVFNGFLLKAEIPDDIHFYGYIVLIAIVFTIIPLFLNLYALNKIDSSTIGILMYINPLINFVIAIVVFKERVSFIQISGYVIIFCGLILFNYGYIKKYLFSKKP